MRCQVSESPSATVSNAKAPAILIKASSLPKCAAAASIAFFACAHRKIDAAEFDPIRRRRNLRSRVIHAGHFCAPRKRRLRNHLAECARGAVTTTTFPSMIGLQF
jgi:hypothetical protein